MVRYVVLHGVSVIVSIWWVLYCIVFVILWGCGRLYHMYQKRKNVQKKEFLVNVRRGAVFDRWTEHRKKFFPKRWFFWFFDSFLLFLFFHSVPRKITNDVCTIAQTLLNRFSHNTIWCFRKRASTITLVDYQLQC